MILSEAYNTLKRCDLTQSQYDFSVVWCGMSRSYLSWVKSSNTCPSANALLNLVFRIEERIDTLDNEEEVDSDVVAQPQPDVAAQWLPLLDC